MRARRAQIAGLLALLLLMFALVTPGAVNAQSDDQALPTELEADEMIYERDLGIVTARGSVEITQGERILFADVVTYNERDDIVTATGNVMLREPSGDVAFAEYVELSDGFKQGIIREIRVQRADRSRLSARVARREGEDRTVLERAVFTRCESCPEHPDRPPIWQIKSGKVTRDTSTEIVEYEDAMFEMFGVPIFYTPYFYHPDPTIDRKSGVLTPIIGSSTELGAQLTLPLYVVLDDTSDFTFSPRVTSKEGVVLGGEYRRRYDNGTFDTTGSITYVDEVDINNRKTGAEEFRGHIQSAGRFDVGRGFESGFDLNRASDDTYLQRYDISSADVLTSDLYLRGIRGRHAASVEFFAFQSLRENDKDGDTPLVLPLASYSTSAEPSVGGRLDGTLSAVALQRTGGRDTRRLSLEGDWAADHIGQFGDLMTFGLHLRGDGYMISEAQSTDITAVNDDEVTGRIWPMASMMWRLPMVKQEGRLMAHSGADVAAFDPALMDKDRFYFSTKLITSGIMYNTSAPMVPASYKDLLKPEAKDRIAMPSPLTSGAATIHMAALTANPDMGWSYYQGLADQGANPKGGNGGTYKAIAGGEKLYGFVVDFLPIRNRLKGAPVAFVFPKEGVSAVTEPVAILSTAKNPDAAKAFVDFLLSPAGQQMAADQGYLAAHPAIAPPEGFPARDQIRLMDFDPSDALENADRYRLKFEDIFGG